MEGARSQTNEYTVISVCSWNYKPPDWLCSCGWYDYVL